MTDCGGDDSVALGRGSTLRLSRLIVLSPWQRIDPPSLLSYLLGRGSLLPSCCLISFSWQRLLPSSLLYYLRCRDSPSSFPIVLSSWQRGSFLPPYCLISLAERLIPSLPIVLCLWQRGSFLPSLLSYLLGRGSFLPPYCLISLAEAPSSLPIVLSPWQRGSFLPSLLSPPPVAPPGLLFRPGSECPWTDWAIKDEVSRPGVTAAV